ncbi:MAG TPA: transposase [Candidatus Omnitrophota bacterium]|nr:transposase [Candidatus Omnitrophota bacterium]HPT07122.1 transposase [Candidatus Omnitrophota bacterium]
MPTGPRLLLRNACYHIITRGNQRQQVFFDDQDYRKYISSLKKYKQKYAFLLYGFCLMPNHIHIAGEPTEPKNMAKFMHGLSLSYTAYFNKRYKKVGHLWQSRFTSKAIVKDNYFIDCLHYIELNPVRACIVKAATEYRWSSHQERIIGKNKEYQMLDQYRI